MQQCASLGPPLWADDLVQLIFFNLSQRYRLIFFDTRQMKKVCLTFWDGGSILFVFMWQCFE
jgi:hypothetical protein